MIILLEGPDGAGKSALANELGDRLSIPVWKREDNPLYGMNVEASQFLHEHEFHMLKTLDADVIVDRWYPSEHVYNQVFSRPYDAEAIKKLDDRARRELDIFGIMLYWPDDVDWKEIDKRTDDEVSVDEVVIASRLYWRWAEYDSMIAWRKINCLKPLNEVIECVMREIVDRRPGKHETYMAMARDACKRSTCLSRRTGAVLVTAGGDVSATGYNGAPRGCPHQQVCERLRNTGTGSGQALDKCMDVHAEENCIIQAARNGCDPTEGTIYSVLSPCTRCARMIINARIALVIFEREYGSLEGLDLLRDGGVTVEKLV